jgi:hypothetical protein
VTFVNHGARLRVEANSPGALDLVSRVLPFGSRIERLRSFDAVFSLVVAPGIGTGDAAHRLYRDSALLQSSPDLQPLLKQLESELHFAVASNARSWLFVHAGVVAWRGRTILLPGRSMSGKSSLVAALLRAGAEYYSDEYAVIDRPARVHPYARPLSLRGLEGQLEQAPRQSQGGRVGTEPLPVHLIVSTRYSPGQRFDPVVREPSHGLMILIANTVVVRARPRFALDHLMPVAQSATTLEGLRGEADEAAAWLLHYRTLDV